MQTLSSKDVSEMLGKRHDNLLRAIRKYCITLGEDAGNYFMEDVTGRNTVYKVTLAGCELLGGRLIGKAGDEFRGWYRSALGASEEPQQEVEEQAPEEPAVKAYTVEEVATILGVSERSIYNWVKQGKLGSVQREIMIPTMKTFITEEDLERYRTDRGSN